MESGSTMTKNHRDNGTTRQNETYSGKDSLTSETKRNIGDTASLVNVQRNTSQRRGEIVDSSWRVNGVQASRTKCSSSVKGTGCIVNNGLVASRGELARNSCTKRKTPAPCVVNEKSNAVVDAIYRAKQPDSFLEEELLGTRFSLETARSTTAFRKPHRTIPKSFSLPDDLREGISAAQRKGRRPLDNGILKRSSAFLANIAQTACRVREKKTSENRGKSSTVGGYFTILNSVTNDFESLYRSPSVQTLPVERKKKKNGVRVKKSVSFSSDTSFEEKRAPYRRTGAVHEVKAYHKGVLQDHTEADTIVRKVPSSWETNSEGRTALLRAARDADDAALNEITLRVGKFGFGDMDVNVADSSGRTAVSYMAGNGTSTMLELALSFDGVDPNTPDNEGNTPLHFAAQAGQTDCLNILLQRCPEIEVDARNASGFTPLMKAALQGRTKCAKILLFAGANPTLRDHGRGLRAEQWARFCGRYVCAEVIERFARHRLLERSTSCRWGSEPELAAKVLQGKVMPIPSTPLSPPSSGFKSKIRKVFRTTSGPDRNFSLVSQLTSAALCASSPALPKSSEVPPVVKSLLRPLSVPQLRVTLVSPQDFLDQSKDKYGSNFAEKIENTVAKQSSRSKKKK
ncbi:uncharacterized protein LOC114878153 isoform X1 [Osmia bicornis bicornis]|uniref:uncharacterized protein LOC114878153 isoform X1 n=2 Tax=Osmia bicornis bicornis TaxID=1437191 RepID=UPI0010F9F745|nr:uncharacterized protein LOC114878153 isoform X1 [Osmia bicornis bicornis]XP_029047450.1 uncharacterized protein LOC114878153 isoform X1 [Osmia bicornis bicornis]XP_029047451.1 uncharacterized protein LOC114878153 isoform X1 [Osmia bicornis bicornis]XP_029047452.1 uncharacterized protein LOC114878153 isoform X1 [Osmia bicornis bicornis]